MQTFRAKVDFPGGYISRLHSDTVFGGLCWAYRSLFGEDALTKMLELCRQEQPPFVVSDFFPGDYLPRPLIPLVGDIRENAEDDKANRLKQAQRQKELKRVSWLMLTDFKRVLSGEPVTPDRVEPTKTAVVLHNTIDRWTGTTLNGGGLYELAETYCRCDYMSLYIKVAPGWEAAFRQTLERLGQMGMGKRRSIGKGGFTLLSFEPFNEFATQPDCNGFVSLSHFAPEATDPVEGRYTTIVTFPKLDRECAVNRRFFKRPLILLTPGSVFYTEGKPREYYGRAVEKLAPGMAEAIQGCFAFAVPAKLME